MLDSRKVRRERHLLVNVGLWQNAPGRISITSDCWMAENMKKGFLGLTAHWIEVVDHRWTLQAAVVGFRSISGGHDGLNLGRYIMGLLNRVGITGKGFSKVKFTRTVLFIPIRI